MAGGSNEGKPGFGERAQQQWNGFLEFLYNPRDKTVMGRSGKSWAKIFIFYVFYYGFLAALFAISISIVVGSLDQYTPQYQTRLQTPGVAIQPKIPSDVEQTSNIMYTWTNNPATQSKDTNYARLVNQITEFLKPYNSTLQTSNDTFRNCRVDEPMLLNQQFQPNQIAKSCRFDRSLLGPCGTAPYGYDKGQPCIYIKLNRIINWFPVGYTDLSDASGYTESKAPSLNDILTAYGLAYKPYFMYTACYGYEAVDKTNLYYNNLNNNKYYPNYMGLPFVFYPYHGKQRQPNYVSPIVAVQLTNVTMGKKIDVACKAYAMNIQDNKEMGEGYFRFDLQITKGS